MMHVEGPQIYQINRQTNSFQNMCDMLWAKIDCLARKIDVMQKKHLKIAFMVDTIMGYLTLEALDGKLLTPGHLQAYPWGYDSSN